MHVSEDATRGGEPQSAVYRLFQHQQNYSTGWTVDGTNKKWEPLAKLIADSIATDPYALEGFLWCRLSHGQRCDKLGISDKTLRRWISEAESIVSRQKEVDGKRTALLRIGKQGPVSEDHMANIMSSIWRGYLTKRLDTLRDERAAAKEASKIASDKQTVDHFYKVELQISKVRELLTRPKLQYAYGCIRGLIAIWPNGSQIDLLKMVLARWPEFMVAMKFEVLSKQLQNQEVLDHHIGYPSIGVIRAFHHLALDMVEMDFQQSGKEPPPWIKAKSPQLWKGIKHKPGG